MTGPRRRRRAARAAALVVGVGLLLGTPAAAGAQGGGSSRTAAAAADLATAAATDDAALEELRGVTSIDGRPVDLAAATEGVDDDAGREEALTALAAELGRASDGAAADPARDRDDARRVLDDDAYRDRSVPKPFQGILRWLADRLAPVGRLLDRVFGPVGDALGYAGYPALALVAGGLAWAVASTVARRSRAVVPDPGATGLLADLSADPAELDRVAEAAEAAGDLGRAVRLRYEAGLIRLVRGGRLVLRPETTASRVATEVGGPAITALTATFEEIVYGGRPGTADDVARARAGWLEVLGHVSGGRR